MLEKGKMVYTTHTFFLSNLSITPLEGSTLVTFSHFLFPVVLGAVPRAVLCAITVPATPFALGHIPSVLALKRDLVVPELFQCPYRLICTWTAKNEPWTLQCCPELLSLLCQLFPISGSQAAPAIPAILAILLPHSTIMQLHRSHRALDISFPLFVISLLYLWKNSRLFIANNVLQQLPSYRFFVNYFIGRNRVGFPTSLCANYVAMGGRVRLLAQLLFW